MPACGRQEMKKPYPERSEGTLEIATGYALATTSGRIATLPLVARNDDVKAFNATVLVKAKRG